MQKLKNQTSANEPDVVESGNVVLIKTNNLMTQPPIFNLIRATRYIGIMYGVVSCLLFYIALKPIRYFYMFAVDIFLMLAFIDIKFILLPKVLRGEVRMVAELNRGNMKTGTIMVSLMRSAFIRMTVIMLPLFIRDNVGVRAVFSNWIDDGGIKIIAVECIIGIALWVYGRSIFVRPATQSVFGIHNKYKKMYDMLTCVVKVDTGDEPRVIKEEPEEPKKRDLSYYDPSYYEVKAAVEKREREEKEANKTAASGTTKHNKPKKTNPAKSGSKEQAVSMTSSQEQMNNQSDIFSDKKVRRGRR